MHLCIRERVFARWCTDGAFAQNRLAPLTGFGRRARSPFCKHDRSKAEKKKKNVLDLLIHTGWEKHKASGTKPPSAAVDTRTLRFSIGGLINVTRGVKNKQNFCAEVFVFGK